MTSTTQRPEGVLLYLRTDDPGTGGWKALAVVARDGSFHVGRDEGTRDDPLFHGLPGEVVDAFEGPMDFDRMSAALADLIAGDPVWEGTPVDEFLDECRVAACDHEWFSHLVTSGEQYRNTLECRKCGATGVEL